MDNRPQFVEAMREWAHTFMHLSMHGFVVHAKSQNLSMSQLGTLVHLHRIGTCAVGDISDDLGVSNAAVSQMLDRLVHNGLVARDEDPADRRAKRVELTGQGRKVIVGVMEQRQRWFEDLADSLSADERQLTADALQILASKARSITEAPV